MNNHINTSTQEVIAHTHVGQIRGATRDGIASFKGVPYAAPTSGTNRFSAPQAVIPWSGVKDALFWGSRCPQERETYGDAPILAWYAQTEPYSEDCCVLNVYTPGLDNKRRPVMVYIHGGGYVTGGGAGAVLDGSNLAKFGDVVVVTLNHRLNVFGFLNLGILDPQGFPDAANAGMLDIVAALKWIQQNISNFGGDPDCVTLFGQSGGGSKIMVLMGMPAAKGLFHRAINMSGTSGTRVATADTTRPYVTSLLSALGVNASQLHELKGMSAERLLLARVAALKECVEGSRPVIDGHHIPASPMDPLCIDLHAEVPLMLGTVETEATFYFADDSRHLHLSREQVLNRLKLQFHIDDVKAAAMMDMFNAENPSRKPSETLITLISETMFRSPMTKAAEAKALAGKAPVFMYNFDWRSPVDGGIWGTPHAMEIPFAFGNTDKAKQITGDDPQAVTVSRNFMTALVAFARNGNPDNPQMPHWRPYDTVQRPSMVIGASTQLVNDYRQRDREAGLNVQFDPFNRSALVTYRD